MKKRTSKKTNLMISKMNMEKVREATMEETMMENMMTNMTATKIVMKELKLSLCRINHMEMQVPCNNSKLICRIIPTFKGKEIRA